MNSGKNLLLYMIVAILISSCSRESENFLKQNVESLVFQDSVEDEGGNIFNSLKIDMKELSKNQYENWVVKSYEGYISSDKYRYNIPSINEFLYPYVKNLQDKRLENNINQLIIESIFCKKNISRPLGGVEVSNTPWSLFENPGYIISNNVLCIPIVIKWNDNRGSYKGYSVLINLKSEKRLYLNDIINVNDELVSSIIYQENFYENIELTGEEYLNEYLNNYYDVDKISKNDVIQNMLEDLITNDINKIEDFYITETSLVLTLYANNSGVPRELSIPKENLSEYIKYDVWK